MFTSHIGYLLLCNKLLQNLVAWNNFHYLIVSLSQESGYGSVGSSSWGSLTRPQSRCWPGLQSSRPDWGRICLQAHSHGYCLSCSPLHTHRIAAHFVGRIKQEPERERKGRKEKKRILPYSSTRNESLDPVISHSRGRDYRRVWMPETEIIAAYLC